MSKHPNREVEEAIDRLCNVLVGWERTTGRTTVLVLRENNGEMAGQPMEQPGYVLRAVNGIPVGRDQDDLPDSHLLSMVACAGREPTVDYVA